MRSRNEVMTPEVVFGNAAAELVVVVVDRLRLLAGALCDEGAPS